MSDVQALEAWLADLPPIRAWLANQAAEDAKLQEIDNHIAKAMRDVASSEALIANFATKKTAADIEAFLAGTEPLETSTPDQKKLGEAKRLLDAANAALPELRARHSVQSSKCEDVRAETGAVLEVAGSRTKDAMERVHAGMSALTSAFTELAAVDHFREGLVGRYPVAARADHPGLFSGKVLISRALNTFPPSLRPDALDPKALDDAGRALAARVVQAIKEGTPS